MNQGIANTLVNDNFPSEMVGWHLRDTNGCECKWVHGKRTATCSPKLSLNQLPQFPAPDRIQGRPLGHFDIEQDQELVDQISKNQILKILCPIDVT